MSRRTLRPGLSLLLAAALSVSAFAGFTSALDPLATAVDSRVGTIDTGFRTGRRDIAQLARAGRQLDGESTSLKRDVRTAGNVSRILDRRFPGDPEFGSLLDQALLDLENTAQTDRTGLAAWRGSLDRPNDQGRLDRALAAFDLAVLRSRSAQRRATRAKRLRSGCRKLERVARRLDIAPDVEPPDEGAAPAFALDDVNPSSESFGFRVSPRDYDGLISAWYFAHST